MWLRIKILLLLIILAILGIGPIPTTSLIFIYVIIFRPPGFKTLVENIYQPEFSHDLVSSVESDYRVTRVVSLLLFVLLSISDIGPLPTVSLICIYVVIFRPLWFKALIEKIYLA